MFENIQLLNYIIYKHLHHELLDQSYNAECISFEKKYLLKDPGRTVSCHNNTQTLWAIKTNRHLDWITRTRTLNTFDYFVNNISI